MEKEVIRSIAGIQQSELECVPTQNIPGSAILLAEDKIDAMYFAVGSGRVKEAAAKGVSIFELERSSKAAKQFLSLGRELIQKYTGIEQEELEDWIEKLHGPRMVPEGVLFALDAPDAHVAAIRH